jgi:RND family efflux transporter MFP subunit
VAAPVDGVVLELLVQQHEWVQEYEPLLVIGDPGRVELELQLPPDQASSVSPGDVVEFVPVGRPDISGRATVITRVPRVDPITRTLAVRASITSRGDGLFPGAFIEGTLTHGVPRTAASVPESAVIRVGGADVVFVQSEVGVYESRPVELGQFNGTRYEVREGVDVGEDVVVQGVFLLKSVLIGDQG